jgi:ElaB/YqjD/DUF883 family membrane-anchored ribosome-binding protein
VLQDGKTLKPVVANDIEGIAAQFSSLRDDLASLTRSVLSMAEIRSCQIGSDITDGVGEAIRYAECKGKSAGADIEKSVATRPLLALGLAAGFGLVIGAMTRR